MDKVSNEAFRVMCDMWGVDSTIKALKRMGMVASKEQIAAATEKEKAAQERWNEICKNCMLYNDGWCEAFVIQKLPNTNGCFGFIPKEKEG